MRHLITYRIAVVGLVVICSLSFCSVGVIAQKSEFEHVLFRAIRCGDSALLKDILRRGTPPDVLDNDGTTALMHAALHGSAEMVALLLKHGADPRAVNGQGVTALLWGAADVDKVRLLIGRGANANASSKLGNTPVMVAAGSPVGALAVQELLAHGADIMPKNKNGRTALGFAVSGGDVATVRLLISAARDLEKLEELIGDAGPTVAGAANSGFHEIVKLLIQHGADVNRSTGFRANGLNAALMAGSMDIAKTLITHGADLGGRSQPGDTPTAVLAAYTELDDSSAVELLKARGVDFTAANEDKQTALTWARMRGHRRLMDSLVEAGAPEGKMPPRPEIPARSIQHHGVSQSQLIIQAVQKSIDLLQLSSDTFLDIRRNCVSCHHQNLPGVAIAWARDRGFHVRQSSINRMVQRQAKSWEPRVDRAYQLDAPYPVPPRFLGWGMWSFAELGYRPNELTRAVSWYLAATQQPDGSWVPGMLRPPLGGNEMLATTLAMRALQFYPLPGREEETQGRIDRTRRWLQDAEPRSHQDEVSRMLGLAWAGVAPEELADEVQRLLREQRDDGGWAQLPGLQSDAWATGQTLVALSTAGGMRTDDPAYRRGIEMLLKTQFDDGSWFVQARTWPFQSYFESKFPHGRDQWVSAPATAWAVMALVLAVDPSEVERLNVARATEAPTEQEPQESPEKPAQLVPAATRTVEFSKDIQPLFKRSCLGCHGEKEPKSNLSITARAALLRGGDSELPAILPGASHESPLVRFAAGVEPEMEMPPLDSRDEYPPLSQKEIALLRAWIDQGAKWSTVVTDSTEQ